MKITKYNNASDIDVEFQDKFKYKVCATTWQCFMNGEIKNPYHPTVCGVGIFGSKYTAFENGKHTKEYSAWRSMLRRSYDKKTKERSTTYKNVICCGDWLEFEKFYEWLHCQSNFDNWLNGLGWALDKDAIAKNNKIYCPEFCCLVPKNVNCLFTKRENNRGELPIGVCINKRDGKYAARCNNQITGKFVTIGVYDSVEEAFYVYKQYKESVIRQIAQIEFDAGNIIEMCYDAMMRYEVEITD